MKHSMATCKKAVVAMVESVKLVFYLVLLGQLNP